MAKKEDRDRYMEPETRQTLEMKFPGWKRTVFILVVLAVAGGIWLILTMQESGEVAISDPISGKATFMITGETTNRYFKTY